jgi:hypothetical protein
VHDEDVCEVDLCSSPEPLFQRLRLVRGFCGKLWGQDRKVTYNLMEWDYPLHLLLCRLVCILWAVHKCTSAQHPWHWTAAVLIKS